MIDHKFFINKLYHESYALLVEARNYFAYNKTLKTTEQAHKAEDRMFLNYQAMRFTSRMTQALAWLMAQRAVQHGEISKKDACNGSFSLGGEKICVDPDGHDDHRLPHAMQILLNRSHSLYHRVLRLDKDCQRVHGQDECDNNTLDHNPSLPMPPT